MKKIVFRALETLGKFFAPNWALEQALERRDVAAVHQALNFGANPNHPGVPRLVGRAGRPEILHFMMQAGMHPRHLAEAALGAAEVSSSPSHVEVMRLFLTVAPEKEIKKHQRLLVHFAICAIGQEDVQTAHLALAAMQRLNIIHVARMAWQRLATDATAARLEGLYRHIMLATGGVHHDVRV